MSSNAEKRILVLTHRFPYPPNRGDRIRSYHLLRVLSQHFRITLGCTSDELIHRTDREQMDSLCDEVFVANLASVHRVRRAAQSLLFGKSLTEGMFASNSLSRRVLSWHASKPFDAVLVYCSSMFPYVDNVAFAKTPVLVDLVDVDSQKWRQRSRESRSIKKWVFATESNRVQSLEQRIADRATAVTLVSNSEAELYRQTVSVTKPTLGISNGVDNEYFSPSSKAALDLPADPLRPLSTLKLVFTGVLDYSPNVEGIVWFCRQVIPELRHRVNVQLSIVGRKPCRRVIDLSKISGVNVVGEVPDVRPYLHSADVAISPLQLARGIQNKVLEAMACGLPVVLTPQSAEGIDAVSGKEFWIADSIEQWCDALFELAAEPNRRISIGDAARRLVAAEYSWAARLCEFVNLINLEPVADLVSVK